MTFPFRSHFNFPFELITEDGKKIETSDEVSKVITKQTIKLRKKDI